MFKEDDCYGEFTQEELQTAVIEIEVVLNSRPLSHISSPDLDEPLTPSHLLTGKRISDHLLQK